jgi:hypothetical protein
MRTLRQSLESALASGVRQPAYKLLAFAPALDRLSAVVTGAASQVPIDLTPYCADVAWTPAQISFTLLDPQEMFHPDTGPQRQYLADKAIIRLKEGDARVDEADWVWTFTGLIRGQCGWQKNRSSQILQSKVTAYSRDNNQALKRRTVTSKSYSVGTDIGIMLYDVAESFLGLTEAEIRVPSVLGLSLKHQVNQLVQVAPWDGIAAILEAVCKTPYFDGEGRLTCVDKNLNRSVDRTLPDYIKIFDYQVPAQNQDCINKVVVTFLDSVLEKVESEYQKLGSAQVTTGFFSLKEELDCWWADDHTQRASGTNLKVVKSVNSGVVPVGSESYREIDEFHGRVTVNVSVWVPILASVMVAEYAAAAFIPDDVVTFGLGASEGITIPLGRVLQAQAMLVILMLMMAVGSAQYEVWGTPFDYAYVEKQSMAIEDGLEYWEENQTEIKNDFIGSYDQADVVALTELAWQKSLSKPRAVVIEDDLALEPGDIVALPNGRKLLITDMQKSVKRGEIPRLTLTGFKVMTA